LGCASSSLMRIAPRQGTTTPRNRRIREKSQGTEASSWTINYSCWAGKKRNAFPRGKGMNEEVPGLRNAQDSPGWREPVRLLIERENAPGFLKNLACFGSVAHGAVHLGECDISFLVRVGRVTDDELEVHAGKRPKVARAV